MKHIFAFALTGLMAQTVQAAPIIIDDNGNPWEVYHFREVRGATSVFSSPSGPADTLGFGITNIVPNGKGENNGAPASNFNTEVVGNQNGVQKSVGFIPDSFEPNRFGTGVTYDPNLTGSWELTVTNGPDTSVVNTPEVGNTPPPARVSKVELSQNGNPQAPIISWDNNDNVDRITITIYDLLDRSALSGTANRVLIEGFSGNTTSFQVPDGLLKPDQPYSVRISSSINRKVSDGTAGTNPSGSSQAGAALVRGSTFFDFATTDVGENTVFIPELTFTGDDEPIFNFNNPVLANQIQFYDPLVAIGYDYQVGEGNPFFNSFILPEIGDDLFDLYLWDGSEYLLETSVTAGLEYIFGDSGVDRFRILGIETGAMLDPTDPTAFVTGLSFVSDGQFTGTMTPISVDIPSAVPLPAPAFFLLAGLAGIGIAGRRKKIH